MGNAAHTVQLSEPGRSLAGCEVSHSHTNTHRIIKLAHDNTHSTVGVRARLLKASEDKFRTVTLTRSSVRFPSAHHLFCNSFCRVKICETNGGKNECIREQDGVFCHRLHASRNVIQINFLPRFMPLCRCEIIQEKMPLDQCQPQAER